LKSVHSTTSALSLGHGARNSSSTGNTSVEGDLSAQVGSMSINAEGEGESSGSATPDGNTIRVVYLTEQVSHHPPISVYYGRCPARHIELMGVDHIAARVSGTTVRVAPGVHNKGLHVKLTGGFGEGEMYRITHPTAAINGILRGSFYVTVSESTIITVSGGRPGMKYRAVLEYKEQVCAYFPSSTFFISLIFLETDQIFFSW
jgi:oxysterol-binding protein-related protein 9/10/11